MTRDRSGRRSGRASWHRRAARPVSVWMVLLFLAVFFHRWLPETRWLLVHLVALGLITNSVLVWSQHFTEALLKHRLPDSARPAQLRRIGLLNLGIVVLVLGMLASVFPAVLAGAVAVGAAVAWHATSLARQLRQALPARFGITVRCYVAAAWLLPVGAGLGAWMASGTLDAAWHARVQLAHEAVNVLGFVGLTVAGTLITLWPTILRTRMLDAAVPRIRWALLVMGAGVALTASAALTGLRAAAAAGLGVYALGVVLLLAVMLRTARTRPPRDYAGLSVLAGVCWLLVGAVWAAILTARQPFQALDLTPVTPVLVAGFLVQVLLGAMTYLLPATMGGGPAAVKAAHREITRWSWGRITVITLCLVLFLLPADLTGSWVRAFASILGVLALFAFLPLMVRGVKASAAVRREADAGRRGPTPRDRTAPPPQPAAPPRRARREILAGAGLTALGTAAGLALDPSGLRRALHQSLAAWEGDASEGGAGTTTVGVRATEGMRFEPSSIEVPAGNSLVIELENTDPTNVHDLVLDSGASSGRVAPGDRARVEVGPVNGTVEGWCSILGHRAMGMTLSVHAVGASPGTSADAGDHAAHSGGEETGEQPEIDFMAEPGADHRTRSAVLEPAEASGGVVHRHVFTVTEREVEVAPGVSIQGSLYEGTYMGPTLRGKVGDEFVITLRNRGGMGHSIDFHAGDVSPDRPMRTIAPGEDLEYRFTARGAGIWLYHCSTMPMSTHIAAGMFGAVVVDPPDLPAVDREYLLVQNETYLATTGETDDAGRQVCTVDSARIPGRVPTLSAFNGHATQYVADPLPAQVGETVRIWVLAAGPSLGLSFHVVGSQFTTVYKEGAYLLRDGRDAFGSEGGRAQALDLSSAQGGFVEMAFAEPGTYTMVNHSFAQMESGARGLIRVTR